MNLKIFTNEQQKFLKKNIEEIERIDSLSKDLQTISRGTNINEPSKNVKVYLIEAYLSDNKKKIIESLRPFKKRDEVFQQRKNEIMAQHGFSPTDKRFINNKRSSTITRRNA